AGMCWISAKDAEAGGLLGAGLGLLAPGGEQLVVDVRGTAGTLPGDDGPNHTPCGDVPYGSPAKAYNDTAVT
ncbi:hypothetical protein ACV334_35545, partial [Pseudomonas aeruginosa]